MLKLALATCSTQPDLFAGEQLLPDALRALACDVDIRVWDGAAVDWQAYDAVLIRCTWDYYEKFEVFLAWLDFLECHHIKVINDIATLRWNLNKQYLFELTQKGLPLIPTQLLRPDDQRSLSELIDFMAHDEIILKPVQSAGAWRTLRVNRDNAVALAADFELWRKEQNFLLQPFMSEVIDSGEWSLIFFNGEFSHAVIKHAKQGDFRVQSDHGGTVQAIIAPMLMRQQAQAILFSLPKLPCYARVDGILRDKQFLLMELELVEPELFLEIEADAPARLAAAIIRHCAIF
ncbi:MAG: hypothetical protein K2P84_03010 [Undibacterium sp.]|nr:hypothetical protein [Undibacterium sp.]